MADEVPKKKFITEIFNTYVSEFKESLDSSNRLRYRQDIKAVMCRGISEQEIATVKQGIMAENVLFGLSRVYVPLVLFRNYRKGAFNDYFTGSELKFIFRIFITMQLISLSGYFAMKWWTKQVYKDHIEIDEGLGYKKKMDDYIVSKTYFKAKKQV